MAVDGIDFLIDIFLEGVDVEAIAGVGGNPAGGGVRLSDEAEVFEFAHFGTNGGGADIKKFGQRNAADGGSHFGIFFDDGIEDFALAVGHDSIIQD